MSNLPKNHKQYWDSNFSDYIIIYARRVPHFLGHIVGGYNEVLPIGQASAVACSIWYIWCSFISIDQHKGISKGIFVPDLGHTFKLTYKAKLVDPLKNGSLLEQSVG